MIRRREVQRSAWSVPYLPFVVLQTMPRSPSESGVAGRVRKRSKRSSIRREICGASIRPPAGSCIARVAAGIQAISLYCQLSRGDTWPAMPPTSMIGAIVMLSSRAGRFRLYQMHREFTDDVGCQDEDTQEVCHGKASRRKEGGSLAASVFACSGQAWQSCILCGCSQTPTEPTAKPRPNKLVPR